MTEFFEVGDKVILNSGGPIMTITSLVEQNDRTVLMCSWTRRDGTPDRSTFDRRTVSLLVKEGPR